MRVTINFLVSGSGICTQPWTLSVSLSFDTLHAHLSEQAACLGADPEDLVRRCGDQQVFSGGRREADPQCRVETGAVHVQNTHVYVEQLDRDGKRKDATTTWNYFLFSGTSSRFAQKGCAAS